MLRYYMTPETRQAVIDESNRLIASRATSNGSRTPRQPQDGAEASTPVALAADTGGDADDDPTSVESAFARLVADLQSAAARRD
jgi:hypothetical protein